jgi:hypothetical protein
MCNVTLDLAKILNQLTFNSGGEWNANAGVFLKKEWSGTQIFKEIDNKSKYWLHKDSPGILKIKVCSCGCAKMVISSENKRICFQCKKELLITEIGLYVG